ncbi:MAG TPA: hypothetical protein EYN05_05720 [Nitrospinaceae bacterium]|nr:hypothetical protein [Nitrospinaceae bacterium]
MRIRLIVIFFVMLAQVSFFLKAEASDEDYHIKILEALKRINIRLVRIETNKIASIKAVQASLLNQIMAIRTSVEQIQATGELNKSEMLASVQGMKTKILDIESHLRNEVMREFDRQNREDKQYRTQLKDSLATDMEGLSKANQQQFNVFSETNNTQLQQIVSALEEQNKKLLQTQALFKTDLIPALDTQSEETRQALLTELSQARVVQKNFLESNHKQTLASLTTIQEKNKALIGVLKKIIVVNETTNQNIDQTKEMVGVLKVRLDKGLTEVKSNQTTATSQLETVVSLSNQIKKQSGQMKKSIEQSLVNASKESVQMEKRINKTINSFANSAQAQADLSSEKLSRLVDILKSFAVEQGKIDQALKAFSVDQNKVDQILQGQKELDVTQKKITEALKDLRRKANVNISRTDDILKKIRNRK